MVVEAATGETPLRNTLEAQEGRKQRRLASLRNRKRLKLGNTIAYASILLILIVFGGGAIVEIAARTTVIFNLRAEIAANQAVLARGYAGNYSSSKKGEDEKSQPMQQSEGSSKFAGTSGQVGIARAPRAPADPNQPLSNEERIKKLTIDERLLASVLTLSAIGADETCYTLVHVVTRRNERYPECNLGYSSPILYVLRLDTWSDEALFLALAICSGALGALLAGLRTTKFTLFQDLALGLGSGFVVYLGMKGGKHVFLLSGSETPILLNPYTYAFAGILVGLFTERAYNLLSSLVDELEKRLLGSKTA